MSALTAVEKAIPCDIIKPYLTKTDRLNDEFLIRRLSPFSKVIKSSILYYGFKHKNAFERNTYIRKTTDELFTFLPKKLSYLFFANDDEMVLLARKCADYCRQYSLSKKQECSYNSLH